MIYRKCSDTPMHIFIRVLTTEQTIHLLKWPVLARIVGPKRLQNAWDDLFSEYNDLVNGGSIDVSLSLIRDVYALEYKLYLINSTVYSLRQRYNERLIKLLKGWGFQFAFTKESYLKDLDRTLSKAKSIAFSLIEKEHELNRLKTGEKTTEGDYLGLLFEISKVAGHRLSVKDISVAEFAVAYNSFKREVENAKRGEN